MANTTRKLQEIVVDGLQVVVHDLKNLSRTQAEDELPRKYYVGDEIEFDILLRNEHSFPLYGLDVAIHQVEAVTFAENPMLCHCEHLAAQSEEKITTVKGTIVANPDDALTPWVIQDYLCRVTINGKFDLPPLEFHDEELKFAYIQSQ